MEDLFAHPRSTQAYLEKILQGPIQNLRYLASGSHCDVLAFEHLGRPLCLKIAAHQELLTQARWAFAYFHSRSSPLEALIPRVYAQGSVRGAQQPYWLIEDWKAGQRLNDRNAQQFKALWPQAVHVLSLLHSSALPHLQSRLFGVWRFEAYADLTHSARQALPLQTERLHASWRDHLAQTHGQQSKSQPPALRPLWESYTQRLQTLLPHCPERGYLIHGDFRPENILASGSQLTGLLDWAAWGAGDFVYDWAGFLLYAPADCLRFALSVLIQHYHERGFDLASLELRLEACLRHAALGAFLLLSPGQGDALHAARRLDKRIHTIMHMGAHLAQLFGEPQ